MVTLPSRLAAGVITIALAATSLSAQIRTVREATPTLLNLVGPGGPPVTGLRASATRSSISVRWYCSTGASGYELYATAPGAAPIKLTASPLSPNCAQDVQTTAGLVDPRLGTPIGTTQPTYSTGFTHAGLAPGMQFAYTVRALWPTGGPADSDPLAARTALWPPPTNIRVSNGGNDQGTIQWEPVSSLTGYPAAANYLVLRKLNGEAAFRQVGSVSAYPFVFHDSGIPIGRHEYVVQAVDGEPSASVPMYAGLPYVGASTHLGQPAFTLAWSGAYVGSTIRIYASALAGGPWSDVTAAGTILQTVWSTNSGQVGTTKWYKVASVLGNVAMESAPVQVTIPPPPVGPQSLKGSYNSATHIVSLEWICDPQAKWYFVMKGAADRGGREFIRNSRGYPIRVSSCSFNDLEYGTTVKLFEYSVLAQYGDSAVPYKETRCIVAIP